MTEPPSADQPAPDAGGALLYPLLPVDPPRVGGYWLDARVAGSPSGVAYAAHTEGDRPAMVVMLSEGATEDAAAVDRFAGTVDKMHIDTVIARGGRGQDGGRLAGKYVAPEGTPEPPDASPTAPWVALDYDGSPAAVAEAERILAEVDLSWLPNLGAQKGPGYALHWIDKVAPGAARQWPLPWPGRPQRAGWASILISWLIMMLLMALAILIAILLFQATPPQSAPDPVPNSASASGGSGSPSPQSGSPSPQSGSPSPQSGSPQPSGSASQTANSPTPNSKL
ncbi:hypothetical protein G7070_17200 [Propioniciclava coleopterorum]|uniref:Uncharacterized protein n=1 Tax=Propioniciclava coleopterorum TaxID=2714937 RepID=A0A6G7YA60_9ACTN|nr:hypothetical protein [Propioniciclava coleopterorum]QIK73683.1 hypothetical protein G7070_17200 [Propioniciclava coleopterorum]